MPESQLQVRLFGSLSLLGDSSVPLPSSAVARSLLAYLLFNRQTVHSRPVLVGLFWPDQPENRGRRALTQALWQIRQVLPDLILADASTVRVSSHYVLWVDVDRFLSLLGNGAQAGADLHAAIELYRGDLLQGLHDDWILLPRERLRESYLGALGQLLELEKAAGQYEQALQSALRLAHANPVQEAVHRELMRLYFALNRPQAALDQFARCRQILQEELGLEPESETTKLAQAIVNQSQLELAQDLFPSSQPVNRLLSDAYGDSWPLVGRRSERAELLTHFESSLQGRGGIVLLEGAAGVGKTRLLQEFARDADWRGADVLWGAGREMEASRPYQPFTEALADGLSAQRIKQLKEVVDAIWLQVLGPLLPCLGVESAPALAATQERTRLMEALSQILIAWSQIKPLVMILEDLHWFDEDTLKALGSVVEHVVQARVLIVASFRGGQLRAQPALWDTLSNLNGASVRARLLLSSLDEKATGELVSYRLSLSQVPTIFASRLYQETEGNPLFVLETLEVLQEEGVLIQGDSSGWRTPWDETTADYSELPLPPAVERTINRRFVQLDEPLQQTLCAAAVLGAEFDFSLLCAAGKQQPQVLLGNLGRLVERRFVQETAHSYRFCHHKIRQVAYHEIPKQDRVRLHQQVAFALQVQQPDQIANRAYHSTHGELWEQAIKLHLQAGQQAASVYATAAALEHLNLSLSLLDKHQPFAKGEAAVIRFDALSARRELYWTLGDAQGQENDVAALCALVKYSEDPVRQVEAWLQQADFLSSVTGDCDGAQKAAEAALELALHHDLPAQANCARVQIGQIHLQLEQHQQAWQLLSAILEDLEHTRPADVMVAYATMIESYTWGGELDVAKKCGDAMLAYAIEQGDKVGQARAHGLLGINAGMRVDYDVAVSHFKAGLALARQIGARHEEAEQIWYLAVYHYSVANFGEAIDLVEQYVTICRQIENRPQLGAALCNLANYYVAIGQYDRAEALACEALETVPQQTPVSYSIWAKLCLAGIHIDRQELEQAEDVLCDVQAEAADSQEPAVRADTWMHLGHLCMARGQFDIARDHFDQAQKAFEAVGAFDYANAACSYIAYALCQMGQVAEAVTLSEQVIDNFYSSQSQNYALEIQWHYGRILLAAGELVAARSILEKVHQNLQVQADSLKNSVWRRDFYEKVPLNRQIVADWETLQAQTTLFRLPRADAPTGRLLQDDEYVQVNWTLEGPADEQILNKVQRRRQIILRLLSEAQDRGAVPTVADLSAALQVSQPTIKRDLAALRQAGHLVQTRGSR